MKDVLAHLNIAIKLTYVLKLDHWDNLALEMINVTLQNVDLEMKMVKDLKMDMVFVLRNLLAMPISLIKPKKSVMNRDNIVINKAVIANYMLKKLGLEIHYYQLSNGNALVHRTA